MCIISPSGPVRKHRRLGSEIAQDSLIMERLPVTPVSGIPGPTRAVVDNVPRRVGH